MIKVIEEKEVPRAQIVCSNCGSLLEYGNADLSIDYGAERDFACASYANIRYHCFTCPVCGCKVSASWIIKKKEQL